MAGPTTGGLAALIGGVDWVEVGAGAPAPAYQNSWDGGGFSVARFRWRAGNMVYLRMVVFGGTPGATVFTLPEGYRPTAAVQIPVTGEISSTMSAGLVIINTDGTVVGERSGTDHDVLYVAAEFPLAAI